MAISEAVRVSLFFFFHPQTIRREAPRDGQVNRRIANVKFA